MPRIWCAISGHGYGHASQVVPVLNELGRRYPSLQVLLRTTVPEYFFTHRLTVPYELSSQAQDVGCVQQGPLKIDVSATWQAYQDFHNTWEQRVAAETTMMKQFAPDLVLSNISYLALDAGACAGIPAIGLGSLSWDHVLHELMDQEHPEQVQIIDHIRKMYSRAEFAIRLTPSLPLESFTRHQDVGPIGHISSRESRKSADNIRKEFNGPLVLVALGGVPLDSLPFTTLDQLSPYQFLLDLPLSQTFSRLRSSQDVSLTFTQLLEASDIIVSKPGYGTVIESVAIGKPLVYARRCNFADEGVLTDYAHRYGRAYELPKEDFFAGNWREALQAVQILPAPSEAPPESGVFAAADMIASYL